MGNNTELATRLENLELKMMELENSFQQINDVVLKQYHDIDSLRQANQLIEKRLADMSENGATPSAEDEVPPHY